MAQPSTSVPAAPSLVPPEPSLLPPECIPDYSKIVTEDDAPVDNIYSEKHQRLLTEPLYSSWGGPGDGRSFLAAADVGVFYAWRVPAIVPDAFVAVDVKMPAERRAEQEKQRAEQEKQRAESAIARAEKLAALLRAQGIDLPPE